RDDGGGGQGRRGCRVARQAPGRPVVYGDLGGGRHGAVAPAGGGGGHLRLPACPRRRRTVTPDRGGAGTATGPAPPSCRGAVPGTPRRRWRAWAVPRLGWGPHTRVGSLETL